MIYELRHTEINSQPVLSADRKSFAIRMVLKIGIQGTSENMFSVVPFVIDSVPLSLGEGIPDYIDTLCQNYVTENYPTT